MANPFEAYRNNPSAPKEPQEKTDERRRKEALDVQQGLIDKNLKEDNIVKAKRALEAKRKIKKYQF